MIPIFSDAVYEQGLEIIRFVQNFKSDPLTLLMKSISVLSGPAYLFFLPFLFWCIDEKKGFRLSMLLFFSAAINTGIKDVLQVPRPYMRDSNVGLDSVHGFSTPSGHSQSSASFWPYAVYLFSGKKIKTWGKIILATLLPLLIGFSRVYLGVHYPSDVLLGWTLGFLFSLGAILFMTKITSFLSERPKMFKILLLAIIALYLNMLAPKDTSMSAVFFGFGAAYILLYETGGFKAAQGSLVQKAIRMLLGMIVIGLIYGGLKFVFPKPESEYYRLFRFLRYSLTGFFAGFILPKLFIVLKLAQNSADSEASSL